MASEPEKDRTEDDYSGNLFGWRISLIGLGVLLFFLSLIVYRHYTMDVPPGLELEESPIRVFETDTTDSLSR